jgi:hypothetical protein
MSIINRIMKTGVIAALAVSVTTGCGEVDSDYDVVTLDNQANFTAFADSLPQANYQVIEAQRWAERPTVATVESIWSEQQPSPLDIEKVEEPNLPSVERIEVDPMNGDSTGLVSADIASGCVSLDGWKSHAWATCNRIDAELVEIGNKGSCNEGEGATTSTFVCQNADRQFSAFTAMVAGGSHSCKPYSSFKNFAAATCGHERLVEMLPADTCYQDDRDTYYRAASFTCIH